MVIRKQFNINNMHIVRNCSSERCKKSIHAHTYNIEVFLESSTLDEGQMVLDFGLTKGTIKEIIKSFDNTYTLWKNEGEEFKSEIKSSTERWAEFPMSPSAESYAICLLYLVNKIMKNTNLANGEGDVTVKSIRVHETLTGYAEANHDDLLTMGSALSINQFVFSPSIVESWTDQNMLLKISKNIAFENEIPTIQISNKQIKPSSLLANDALIHYSNVDVSHMLLLELGNLITTTNYKWWKNSNMDKIKISAILYTIADMALVLIDKIDLIELAKLHAVIETIDPEASIAIEDDAVLSHEVINLTKALGSMIYTNDYWDIYRNVQMLLHILGNDVIGEFKEIHNAVSNAEPMLLSIVEMQDSLNVLINPEWITAKQDWQSAMFAESIEAIESIDLNDSSKTDIPNIIVELIDLVHFNISVLLELNAGDKTLLSSNLYRMILSNNKDGLLLPIDDDADILADLTKINSLVLKGEYVATLSETFKCLGRLNVTFEESYNIYLAKNALNIVRQKFGYKTGEYVKMWNVPTLDGTEFSNISFSISEGSSYEDNVIVQEIAQNVFTPTFELADLTNLVELISTYYTNYIKE